jgi:predicted XRE-type DNA-binding protein
MPKVFITENDRLTERLVAWIYGQMKVKRIPQRQIAEELNISQPAFAQKLKNRSFSFTDFLTIVRIFEPDTED